MVHTKKLVGIFLLSTLLASGVWYLNSTGMMEDLRSSVFGRTFVCNDENIKLQAPEYRKTAIQLKKAKVYREQLESTIRTLRDQDKISEMEEEQAKLRILIRGIGAYNRFISAYTACQNKKQRAEVPVNIVSGENTIKILEPLPASDTVQENTHNAIVSPSTIQAPINIEGNQPITQGTTEPSPALPVVVPTTTEAVLDVLTPVSIADEPLTTQPSETTEIIPDTTQGATVTEGSSETQEDIPENTQPDTTSSLGEEV